MARASQRENRTAERTDRSTAVREIAEFFHLGADRLLGFTHLPPAPARAGLLICSPLHAERVQNYRREVLLARLLAARGVAVQRFDYRGTGNSGGAPEQVSCETMCADARAALERLRHHAAVTTVAVLGTRLAAIAAAATAARLSGAPLVLWEPVRSPARYFSEVFRARLMARLAHARGRTDGAETRGSDVAAAEMHGAGSVDVLGHAIARLLYESVHDCALEDMMSGPARPILLVQLGGGAPRQEYAELRARWRAAGADVEHAVVRGYESWWLSPPHLETEERRPLTRELLGVTERWLEARWAERATA